VPGRNFLFALLLILIFAAAASAELRLEQKLSTDSKINDPNDYSIAGLPHSRFKFEDHYDNGSLHRLDVAGTVGYVLTPDGPEDPNKRWVWICPMQAAVPWDLFDWGIFQQWYVEELLAKGFHVVGCDIGPSCGSPAGAEVFHGFYEKLMSQYKLNPKARLTGQSNGGLIAYCWAFRHPELVDRIAGIMPATDLSSWPGYDRLCPPNEIVAEGISYGVKCEDWSSMEREFSPIDNLEPLAAHGVKIYHVHGDVDKIVPIEENTYELRDRYQSLGGDITVEVILGGEHGPPAEAFFESQDFLEFLLAP
jgi:pimeloyl-ACP methyl ester carboxylesterase